MDLETQRAAARCRDNGADFFDRSDARKLDFLDHIAGPDLAGGIAAHINIGDHHTLGIRIDPETAPKRRGQLGQSHAEYRILARIGWRIHYNIAARRCGFLLLLGQLANSHRRRHGPVAVNLNDGNYWCAPQVFYFTPHKKWYLVYQVGVPGQKKMWVAYSTTTDISDPTSWTKAKPMLDGGPNDSRKVGGIDYWIICDDRNAYLFFTSNNGKMWRMTTSLDKFPNGFDDCQLVLQAKIFEACHIYKVKGTNQYINVIEENGRRYFKAYVANRLDGPWLPIADSAENPFAGWQNVRPSTDVTPWTDNISHGELVRAGFDEKLEVDPKNWQFVFQGCFDKEKRGKGYGLWPWRIGVLTPIHAAGIGSR